MENSSSDIRIFKERVRKSVKSRLSFLTWAYKREASEFITLKTRKLPEYINARCVMVYVSTENEPDTEALINDCLKKGKRVMVPRCKAPGEMVAVEIHSMAELVPGKYDIPEPLPSLPEADSREIDFCIVPCMAAGEHPRGKYCRLGHGMGYYDRFLPKLHCTTCVLCFRELVREIPVEDTDVLIDIMITE